MLGADITIHSNSTTGLEAAILGVPCLNLNKAKGSRFSRTFATDRAPPYAKTAKEAAFKVAKFIARSEPSPTEWLPHFPANAAETIARHVSDLSLETDHEQARSQPPRKDHQVATFAISEDVFMSQVAKNSGSANITRLDDSCYLLTR